MQRVVSRLVISALSFSIGIALALASRIPFDKTPRHLKAGVSGETQLLSDRFTRRGGLPEHDEDETNHFSCEFVSDTVGWLVNGARLWRTTDGGTSWKLIYSKGKVNRYDDEYIDHLKFVSPKIGWMLVDQKLVRTDDGGDTWHSLPTPKADFLQTFEFLPDGRLGWIAGMFCQPMRKDEGTANRFYCGPERKDGYVAAVFITRDGGQTWQRQAVVRRFGDIGYIRMRDASHGFAIGQAGTFRYRNGRWLDAESTIPELEKPEAPTGEYCLQVITGMPTFRPVNFQFTDALHGLLSNSNGYLGRTNDGGRTWFDISRCADDVEQHDPPFFSKFTINQYGWGFALDSEGGLHETFDGGVTWDRITSKRTFIDMFGLSPERVWLIADDGIYQLDAERQ